MSNLYYIIIFIILFSHESIAQFIWIEGLDEGKTTEHVTGQKMNVLPSDNYLNHHPLFRLEHPIEKIIPVLSGGLTVFTVSMDKDNRAEQLIWKVHQYDHDNILHTTMRTANLTDGQFINHTGDGRKNALLTTYYVNHPFGQNAFFQLGMTPNNRDIPVEKFTGYFGEVIAFEKVLSPLSIQIVQTILALKYSLNLPIDHDYLGLHGEQLWNRKSNTFQHHIGGIGRLDKLHFDQSMSTIDLNQGNFTISATEHVFDDNHFVLWGDDGKSLKYNDSNGVKTLDRTWQISNIRNKDPEVRITIEHPGLINDIDENESFYGIVQSKADIMILPLEKTEQNTITGQTVLQQDETIFQLAKAPLFWSYMQISAPSCDSSEEGTISGQIIGGQSPYHIVVKHNKNIEHSFMTDKNLFYHNITTGGEYMLTVSDKNNQKWQTNLIVNYKEIPKPSLSNVYYQTEEEIHITPYNPKPNDIHLEWILPDRRHQFSDKFNPSESGQYTLNVNNGSCENQYDFEIINNSGKIIDARVFPNPSNSFYQYLTANLEEAGPYRISITSQAGRLIALEDFPASKYIFQEFSLDPGIYIISLQAGDAVFSHPLIVLQN